MSYKYDMSRQEQIDRMMCKPGYTWNETLQKCLGYGGGIKKDPASSPKPTPDQAIAEEVASRESTGEVQ